MQANIRRRAFLASTGVLALATSLGLVVRAQDAPPPQPVAPDTLPLTPECVDSDDLTPAQTEGPYFTPNSPQRASLLEPDMSGTRLLVSGYVLTPECVPVSGALLDFWQADDAGQYDNVGYRLRGHQYTDEFGRYTLETIVPGLYPGRTRHIHMKVQAPNARVLTTQLYFEGEPRNRTDGIFDPRLVLSPVDIEGGRSATYNFVVTA
jgi:protocatechuate 3,4-dioxygenase beta subunit